MHQIRLLAILFIFIVSGCSHINKASDFITKPTAKEKYQRDFDISDELFAIWQNQAGLALQDSLQVDLPYVERGKFNPRSFQVYSYEVELKPGEIISFEAETDTIKSLVFIDLYQKTGDSLQPYEKIETAGFREKNIIFEPEQAGKYKLVVQPEIEANSPFLFKISKNSAYIFPVLAVQNSAIQSFWGAARDGGVRSHEGIDIFAERGTPVLAATDGRITYSGEKGLGGKQVWLRDSKRKQSLYYAHLDSIHRTSGRVKIGDTLGYVGNSGNARTTPPHLHFGIYKSYRGAIDPLSFVYQIPELEMEEATEEMLPEKLVITSARANLRNKPNTRNSEILKTLASQDTLSFMGKTREWYHVRRPDNKASFIHQSLVTPI